MSISVQNISKKFRIFKREAGLSGAMRSFFNRRHEDFYALHDVDVEIDDGEILGILGENGAGKTTLIKILVGLLFPTDGVVVVDGFTPWERKHDFLRRISVVMGQKNQLWWDIPASESFLLNKRIYNIPDADYQYRLDELVDLLDVRQKLNLQVRRLSLGERMKMELIASLLHSPRIVLLDEPTIGLDVISQSRIRDFVRYYNEQYQTTIILTSHYMNDIEQLCRRVLVIHKGKPLYDGDFKHLVQRIHPQRKLTFAFSSFPDFDPIRQLQDHFEFKLDGHLLTAELPDSQVNLLLSHLFQLNTPQYFSLEELPVEDTMKAFFANPEQFI